MAVSRWSSSPHYYLLLLKSLTPGRYGSNFRSMIFKLSMQNSSLGTCCQIAIRRKPQKIIDDRSTLVQVKAWCQAITWANSESDLHCYMASLGCSELEGQGGLAPTGAMIALETTGTAIGKCHTHHLAKMSWWHERIVHRTYASSSETLWLLERF